MSLPVAMMKTVASHSHPNLAALLQVLQQPAASCQPQRQLCAVEPGLCRTHTSLCMRRRVHACVSKQQLQTPHFAQLASAEDAAAVQEEVGSPKGELADSLHRQCSMQAPVHGAQVRLA